MNLHPATCISTDSYVELKDDGLIRMVVPDHNEPGGGRSLYISAGRDARQLALQVLAACDEVDRRNRTEWESCE